MKKTIFGNTIVYNEDRYLWFAIESVIDYLDKIVIYDTGSTDNTAPIIELLKKKYPRKIIFKQIGRVDKKGMTEARRKMLKETENDWFLILDGDEVWWERSINKLVDVINTSDDKLKGVALPVINLIGDIYHYQEEAAGQYQILGRKGHLNLRAIKKIPGLHIENDYPLEGYYDNEGRLIQEGDLTELVILDTPIMHFTHLKRSSKERQTKRKKFKYEMGVPFSNDFKYPEVFYGSFPFIVPSPFQKMTLSYKAIAAIRTPLVKLKRRIFKA